MDPATSNSVISNTPLFRTQLSLFPLDFPLFFSAIYYYLFRNSIQILRYFELIFISVLLKSAPFVSNLKVSLKIK